MKFKVMSNDVGSHAYSALKDVEALNVTQAMSKAESMYGHLPTDPRRRDKTLRLLVLPYNKLHLHSGITGKIKPEAQRYVLEIL